MVEFDCHMKREQSVQNNVLEYCIDADDDYWLTKRGMKPVFEPTNYNSLLIQLEYTVMVEFCWNSVRKGPDPYIIYAVR